MGFGIGFWGDGRLRLCKISQEPFGNDEQNLQFRLGTVLFNSNYLFGIVARYYKLVSLFVTDTHYQNIVPRIDVKFSPYLSIGCDLSGMISSQANQIILAENQTIVFQENANDFQFIGPFTQN